MTEREQWMEAYLSTHTSQVNGTHSTAHCVKCPIVKEECQVCPENVFVKLWGGDSSGVCGCIDRPSYKAEEPFCSTYNLAVFNYLASISDVDFGGLNFEETLVRIDKETMLKLNNNGKEEKEEKEEKGDC